jgi:ribosomal protein L40E
MAEVHRICASCGKNTPLDARHCPHCGHDTVSGLPMKADSALPAVMGKAALPVLATAGTLVARMVWRLVRERMLAVGSAPTAQAAPPAPVNRAPLAVERESQQAVRRGRSVRIRTSWAVGDANGLIRRGYTDQQIDFDE